MKLLVVILASAFSTLAFEPIYKETNSFRNRVARGWSAQNDPKHCKFETFIKNNQVNIRAGIVGSPVDYFGWNAPIELEELPLKVGFKKVYATAGTTAMELSYDGKVLTFQKVKSAQVWNRLFPFSIEIDPNLSNPKVFKGTMEGYESARFGGLKKHVSQKCNFK